MGDDRAWAPLGGMILYGVARALGARVTSWKRDEERNAEVGGSPTSLHLVGGAVDVGRELAGWRLNVLKWLGTNEGPYHVKGTAPHWHFEGGLVTVIKASAVLAAAWYIWRG